MEKLTSMLFHIKNKKYPQIRFKCIFITCATILTHRERGTPFIEPLLGCAAATNNIITK